MTTRHRALIVEDDKATAEDLLDIVNALECDAVVFDNKRDALAALDREVFCFALLDLQLKNDRDSIRGHVAAGESLIQEVRRRHPQHAGSRYSLPILVVSGHVREVDSAVAVMKDGADDVIQKPLDSRKVSERVRQALELSGRSSHEACTKLSKGWSAPSDALAISFPGERHRRRTKVLIGRKSVNLTDTMLWILLQLVVAKLSGTAVHKIELGARADQGFRGISELRKALEPVLADGENIIENDHQGNYGISVAIALGACDVEQLIAIGDTRISALAEKLRAYRDPKV